MNQNSEIRSQNLKEHRESGEFGREAGRKRRKSF
jgi:hypothetical protein